MQDLRSQIDQLKQDLISVTNGADRDSEQAIAETQEVIERTIAPPVIRKPDITSTSQPVNPVPSGDLPNRLEVPDDPDS